MAVNTKIVGSLVAVAALWLGSTAYIGSNTETYLKRYVDKNNKMYEAQGIKLSIDSFEKGFFASEANIKVDFVEPTLKEAVSEIFTLPLNTKYSIENGPIFFKNGLGMGSSRIVNNINLSDYLADKEAFKKIVKDDIVINSMTSVDFSNDAVFSANTNEIVAQIEEATVAVSPLKITGDMNLESFVGEFKMFVDALEVKSEQESLSAKSLVIDGDITKFYDNGFYLGDFSFDIDAISTKGGMLPFELEGATASVGMNIDQNKDETINMKFNMDADVGDSKLPLEYAALNKIKLAYALNGTTLEGVLAFQDYTKRLQAQQQKVMAKLSNPANGELDMNAFAELEKLQTQAEEELMLMVAGLLKKDSTNFVFETTMVDKKSNESSLKMNVGYVGDTPLPTTAKELEDKFTKEFLNLLTLDLNVELNKDYIANLPVDLQEELMGQLQMGAMFGVVKDNNSSYNFDANYKPKTLTVNGEDRTEMIQMLQMGLESDQAF